MTFFLSSCLFLALTLTVPGLASVPLLNAVDSSHNCVNARCRPHMGWPGHPFPADSWGVVIDPMLIGPVESAVPNGVESSPDSSFTPTTLAEPTYSPLSLTPSPSSIPTNLSSLTRSKHSSTLLSTPRHPTSTPSPPPPSSTAPLPPPTATHSPSSHLSPTSTSQPPSSSAPSNVPSAGPGPGSGSPSGPTSPSDIQAYLSAHNAVRAQHGAAPLTYFQDLAAKAQQWADGCVFQHSQGQLGPFGENLAAGNGPNYGISQAIQSWTDEASQYDPNNPQPSHFTQVVWKGTTQVGCGVQVCSGILPGKAHFFVCEYSPPGNVIGQFATNVQA